eukprot:COSAG02_NODE_3628_length_6450_cov_12.534876_3_plen_363_part_00
MLAPLLLSEASLKQDHYAMSPIGDSTLCLDSSPGVMDLEDMWSLVDAEQSDRTLDIDRPGEDLEWVSTPEVTEAEATIVSLQFQPLLSDPVAMNLLSPTRSPAQPSSHRTNIDPRFEEHSSDQPSTFESNSAPDKPSALQVVSGASTISSQTASARPGIHHERDVVATRVSTVPTPSTVAEQEGCPARCPFCGNVPIVPGRVVPTKEDRRPVGGVLEKGRYKVRAAPRKENRLAQWQVINVSSSPMCLPSGWIKPRAVLRCRYAKYGYTGVLYCKACSESFRSHLTRTQTRALNGCSRVDPCDHCTKVLSEFDCSREQVFERFDNNRAVKAAKRRKSPPSTAKGQEANRRQQKVLKQRHQPQ